MNSKHRFNSSQYHHKRLMNKHIAKYRSGDDFSWVKGNYHSAVLEKQKKIGRILTKEEKQQEYNSTLFYYYN